jgi:hypothetical protein
MMEEGILRKDKERFDKENKVWLEARKVLGDDVVDRDLSRSPSSSLVSKRLDKFDNEGSVQEWLAGVN